MCYINWKNFFVDELCIESSDPRAQAPISQKPWEMFYFKLSLFISIHHFCKNIQSISNYAPFHPLLCMHTAYSISKQPMHTQLLIQQLNNANKKVFSIPFIQSTIKWNTGYELNTTTMYFWFVSQNKHRSWFNFLFKTTIKKIVCYAEV